MKKFRVWLLICFIGGLVISFQNCSTLRMSSSGSSGEDGGRSHEAALAALQTAHEDQIVTGTAGFWTLAGEDELIAPQFKGRRDIYGSSPDARYLDGLRNARELCMLQSESSQPAHQIAFELYSSHGAINEGRYLVPCDQPLQTIRQPASSDTAMVALPNPTGKIIIQYPEFGMTAEPVDLYQADNELRFMTAMEVAAKHCEHLTPQGRVVKAVDFEITSSSGREGKYHLDCKSRGQGRIVAHRALK